MTLAALTLTHLIKKAMVITAAFQMIKKLTKKKVTLGSPEPEIATIPRTMNRENARL